MTDHDERELKNVPTEAAGPVAEQELTIEDLSCVHGGSMKTYLRTPDITPIGTQ